MTFKTQKILPMLLALSLAFGATACQDDSAGPEVGADVEDVQIEEFGADPEAFIGEEVTVSGAVSEVLGPNSFTIGGGDVGGDALLVVSATTFDLNEGEVVEVTGEVTADFVVADVEDDLAIDFTPDIETFVSENYIVASEVEVIADDS